ncbi:MAG TPA: hypothetical protein PKE69_27735, partial [Pyrinomonadaceae bacterium]|nr:hypothetical protein [Pyrinomonadaceae bacterium]
MLKRKILSAFVLCAFLFSSSAFAQTAKIYEAPKEVIDKIKDEGMNRSQVMNTLSYLTDVIGGRLTNSPSMKRANEWTRDTMAKWGMQNASLVSWGPFGRGWSLKRFSAQVSSPQTFPLIAYPKAWSPGLKQVTTADVVYLDAETDADFEKYKGQLKGKIVLVSGMRELKADFDGMAFRHDADSLLSLANAENPLFMERPQQQPNQQRMQRFLQAAKKMNFLMTEGAAMIVDNSFEGSGGTLFVGGASVAQEIPANPTAGFRGISAYQKEAESKMIPQMTLATED